MLLEFLNPLQDPQIRDCYSDIGGKKVRIPPLLYFHFYNYLMLTWLKRFQLFQLCHLKEEFYDFTLVYYKISNFCS